jgi:hypothetical protein
MDTQIKTIDMSKYVQKSGAIEFHYGWDEKHQEYWYQVYDNTRKHIDDGLLENEGSKSTGMPPLVLAEKMKQFNAPTEHIRKVLWMRKI